eukprot:Selendium_serpulae@DN5508_c0_g1_i3.p1
MFEQQPDLLKFYDEVKCTEHAVCVNLGDTENDINQAKRELANINATASLILKINEQDPQQDSGAPHAIPRDFISEAEQKVEALEAFLAVVKAQFVECGRFFGETNDSVASCKQNQYFATIWEFANDVETIRKSKQEQLDREQKESGVCETTNPRTRPTPDWSSVRHGLTE